mmetsp:Transcript_5597/g.21064  ORF Transcript_5597/g.21064 Transcript_5597/m.21064 type:complete len:92 (-) Transcript_5597:60-335(-)
MLRHYFATCVGAQVTQVERERGWHHHTNGKIAPPHHQRFLNALKSPLLERSGHAPPPPPSPYKINPHSIPQSKRQILDNFCSSLAAGEEKK